MRPLAGPLALHLVGEGDDGEQHLVSGGVDRAFPVVEVQEHPHAGLAQLLERIGRLDLLPAEAGLFGHDEHLEWRAWLERGHEPEEARTGAKFGARHPVVHVDVRGIHDPALARGIGLCVLDLAGHGLGLIGDAVLVGALPGVDGGDHAGPSRFIQLISLTNRSRIHALSIVR
jgi:hypothetical protein